MSKKLSATQINILNWMYEGANWVMVCTEVSNQLGVMTYSGLTEFETDKRAIFNLLRDGYLEETEECFYGLRWATLNINRKGVALLESLND
tara:strand:+ start:365 stop:637 length:273 start_codon:yes stop_codon:yes gene_type:complete